MGRGRRRRNQLPNDLKERKRYRKFKKAQSVFRTLRRNRFGRGYGPVVKTDNVRILMMMVFMYVRQKILYDYVYTHLLSSYMCMLY